jgi:hypothetical protein
MASIAVFSAVSYPMVKSVPKISLSIVPGTPITFIPNSSLKILAPVKVPSPPIHTKASIPIFYTLFISFFLPSSVLNSAERAERKIVLLN